MKDFFFFGCLLAIVFFVSYLTIVSLESLMEVQTEREIKKIECLSYGDFVDINLVPLKCRDYFE